jgi:hypothetical protein
MKGNVGGGFATFENDKYHTLQYFYKCCGGDKHLCHLFYEMNPSDDCSNFNPADEPIARKRRFVVTYFSGGSKQRVSVNWVVYLILISGQLRYLFE